MATAQDFLTYFYESWNQSGFKDRRAYNTAIAIAETKTGITPGIVNGVATVPGLPSFQELQQANGPVATNPPDPSVPNTETEAQNQRELNRVASQAPAPVPPSQAGPVGTPYDDDDNLNPGWTLDEDNNPVYVGGDFVEPATAASAEASRQQATILKAQEQATLQQRYNQTTTGDWRVRIRLAPSANYLYKAKNPGIMSPLVASDGVIFPYLPTVQTRYEATYDRRDLTHSNYRGYFYKNSSVGEISVNGTFTAQDTWEAQYLLAVIHFFRSATKMFYGKDEFRGAPPPLVMLSGFGEYQFNGHPCLISNFNYTLPNGVDYIRVNPNNQGQNLVINRNQVSSSPASTIETAWRRISGLVNLATGGKVDAGAQSGLQDLGYVTQTVSGTSQTTYVPTKMEIQITLLPVQTRSQVSQQFSLKEFANGNLLKGGFW